MTFRVLLIKLVCFSLLALATFTIGPFIGASYQAAADRASVVIEPGSVTAAYGANSDEILSASLTAPFISTEERITWSPAYLTDTRSPKEGCYTVQRGVTTSIFGFSAFTPVAGPVDVCR